MEDNSENIWGDKFMESQERAPEEQTAEAQVEETVAEPQAAGKSEVEQRVEDKLQGILETTPETQVSTTEDVATPKAAGETPGRGEVSASTVARMMGLATASEMTMMEGKIDLLSSRVGNMTVKLERIFGTLGQLPTATDMDRIDINIGSLKTLIRESLEQIAAGAVDPQASGDAGKLKKATIMTSDDDDDAEVPAEQKAAAE